MRHDNAPDPWATLPEPTMAHHDQVLSRTRPVPVSRRRNRNRCNDPVHLPLSGSAGFFTRVRFVRFTLAGWLSREGADQTERHLQADAMGLGNGTLGLFDHDPGKRPPPTAAPRTTPASPHEVNGSRRTRSGV